MNSPLHRPSRRALLELLAALPCAALPAALSSAALSSAALSSAALSSAALSSAALSSACASTTPGATTPDALPAEGAAAPPAAADSPPQLLRVSRLSSATQAERDYFLYLPAGYASDASRRWPVLLFLHGNGERGDAQAELDFLLKNGPLYEAWIQKRELPFLIVAPQLPMYGMDAKADYLKNRTRAEIPVRLEQGVPPRPTEFPTPEPLQGALSEDVPAGSTGYGPPKGWPELEADVLGMLQDVLAQHRGDPERVYLTGVSYGGFGTWYLASHHAERFAAIAPVVGYGHPELMPALASAQLPIWCFAGGRDNAVKLKYFYPGLNRLEALGHKEVRFTVEADMGHDVWARVYAGHDLYDWLLLHSKAPSATAPASAP